jgi:CoA:oxalate CoA-transferase
VNLTDGTVGASRPLDGIKIVDLTTFLSGPFGTQILADLGAEVLKVEPLSGDSSRAIPPHFIGEDSAYFLGNNRNKRSIAVDLKSDDGKAIALELIAGADVVVENFRPEVCQRLGLDPEKIRAQQPSLVWASISGFGQTGEFKDNPAYDMVVQALSGVMSLTGEEGRPAMRLGIPAGDLVAGMFAAIGVLAALVRKQSTGAGALIDVSMLDGQLAMVSYQAVYAMLSGKTPLPQGAKHDSIPTYRSFLCADDRELVVTANTDRMWKSLCKVLGHPELIESPLFVDAGSRLTNREDLWQRLEAAFLKRPTTEWVKLLQDASVPVAPINTVTEALTQAESYGRDMVLPLSDDQGHKIKVVGNPVKFTGTFEQPSSHSYPPRLGEHTREVLIQLGHDAASIDAMVSRGVVKAG